MRAENLPTCATQVAEATREAFDTPLGLAMMAVLESRNALLLSMTDQRFPLRLAPLDRHGFTAMVLVHILPQRNLLRRPRMCGTYRKYHTTKIEQVYIRSGVGMARMRRPFSMVVANDFASTSLYASPSLPSTCSLA